MNRNGRKPFVSRKFWTSPSTYVLSKLQFTSQNCPQKTHLLLEISIFSLNDVIVRPTKIMNNLLKDYKILTFKLLSQHQKTTESF